MLSDRVINPQNTSQILKALLQGFEIETEHGIFKYFRKGEWVPISSEEEGEIAQEGIFKRCEVVHHTKNIKQNVKEACTEYRWLLWLSSLSDFVAWAETITPREMAIINANIALNSDKTKSLAPSYDLKLNEVMEEIEL